MKSNPKRETCESFDNGYCDFYQMLCFHTDEDPLGYYRCNRLIPRRDGELMPWMDILYCTDCNEPVCNGCDIYIEYRHEEILQISHIR